MYIIGRGKLITLSGSTPLLENGAVAVDGGTIVDVGKTERMLEAYPSAEFIDVDGAVIAPGFIDMHAHSRNVVFGSAAIPRFRPEKRFNMLKNCLWQLESGVDHSIASALAYAFAIRAIKNGITTVFEQHSVPDHPSGSLYSIASVFRECGLRACIGYDVSERFGSRRASASIKENAEFIEFCASLNIETVKPAFGMNSSLELGNSMLAACIGASSSKARIHIHIGETPEENLIALRRFGCSPIQKLFQASAIIAGSLFLCGPFTDKSDLELIVANDCAAVISPSMASLLSCAYSSEFEKMALERKLCLGTDSLCAGMLEAARNAVFQFGISGMESSSILLPAVNMLFYANPDAASRVFGRRLGVIEPGAAADIIALRPCIQQQFETEDELLGSLIWSGAVCELTMVNGRILMRGGKLSELDEKRIANDYSAAASKLLSGMLHE